MAIEGFTPDDDVLLPVGIEIGCEHVPLLALSPLLMEVVHRLMPPNLFHGDHDP